MAACIGSVHPVPGSETQGQPGTLRHKLRVPNCNTAQSAEAWGNNDSTITVRLVAVFRTRLAVSAAATSGVVVTGKRVSQLPR